MTTIRNTGPLWVLIGSLTFSTLGTAQMLAPESAAPYVLGVIRLFGGGIVLLAWCLWYKLLPTRHGWWRIETLICIAGLIGFQLSFFEGIIQTGVAVGSVVSIGVTPLATGFFCRIFLREQLTHQWFISTFIALAGLGLLAFAKDSSIQNMYGLLFAILAGFFYSSYLICSKRLLDTHQSATVTMVLVLVAGLCMLPFVFSYPLAWICTPYGFAISMYFAIVTTAFTLGVIVKGLQTTSAATASTLSLAEPLGAALLGIFFLGEPLNVFSGLGMLCILLAVIWLVLPTKNPPQYAMAKG